VLAAAGRKLRRTRSAIATASPRSPTGSTAANSRRRYGRTGYRNRACGSRSRRKSAAPYRRCRASWSLMVLKAVEIETAAQPAARNRGSAASATGWRRQGRRGGSARRSAGRSARRFLCASSCVPLVMLSSRNASTTVNSSVPNASSANDTPLINDWSCRIGDSSVAGMRASSAAA